MSEPRLRFEPNLAEVLEDRVRQYREYKDRGGRRPKPLILVVITDGEALDHKFVEDCIVNTARTLDELRAPEHYIGIQFLQVGDDPVAAEWLRTLDDDLQARGVRDVSLRRDKSNRTDQCADGRLHAVEPKCQREGAAGRSRAMVGRPHQSNSRSHARECERRWPTRTRMIYLSPSECLGV